MILLILFILSFILALALTDLVRVFSKRFNLLDHPVDRSSHVKVTPRGGGLAIVVAFFITLALMAIAKAITWSIFSILLVGGLLVALVGWLDDIGKANVAVKLSFHFLAAIWIIWKIGALKALDLGFVAMDLKIASYILTLLTIVWLTNLYNFMDGIDAIAAAEAIFVAIFGGIMLKFCGLHNFAYCLWALAASVLGFLRWNWPPAKIFMGDVGSGFLGFIFATFVFISAREKSTLVWPWLILLGVFVVDATTTLIRRILKGSQWHRAHKRHAYQHIAQKWGHRKTTIAITIINLLWLAPLSIIALFLESNSFVITLIALIPLLFLSLYFKAGLEK